MEHAFPGFNLKYSYVQENKTLSISNITAASCFKKSKWYQGWVFIWWLVEWFLVSQKHREISEPPSAPVSASSTEATIVPVEHWVEHCWEAPPPALPPQCWWCCLLKKKHQMWTAVTCSWTSGQNCFPFLIRQSASLKKTMKSGPENTNQNPAFLRHSLIQNDWKTWIPWRVLYKMCSKK